MYLFVHVEIVMGQRWGKKSVNIKLSSINLSKVEEETYGSLNGAELDEL